MTMEMTILLLTAMKISDNTEVPARMELLVPAASCQQIAESFDYWIKYKSYKIEATCQKKSSLSPTTSQSK